jgi:hypothetical protein
MQPRRVIISASLKIEHKNIRRIYPEKQVNLRR